MSFSNFNGIKNAIISPPFGTWLSLDWATPVIGTFTYHKRPGNRFWRAVQTLRPIKGGWVNRIGLRNPGIYALDRDYLDYLYHLPHSVIVSIHGSNDKEWDQLLRWIEVFNLQDLTWELNVSCPNVEETEISDEMLKKFAIVCPTLIVKLSPVRSATMLLRAVVNGVRHFHFSNTIPTERGGESGKRLKEYNLPVIEMIKSLDNNVKIIGGGGIYSPQDVDDYYNAGADKISLSTIWFTPWKVSAVRKRIEKLYGVL